MHWPWRRRYGRSRGFREVRRAVRRAGLRDITVVETGTIRRTDDKGPAKEGWSTVFFRGLIDEVGGELHSVDIDPEAIATSRRVVEVECGDLAGTHHHCRDSVAFLHEFPGRIDVLYLDSYDYEGGDAAARHQLAEIENAIDKLSERAVVLLDDIYRSIDQGKPALSIPFLKSRGWSDVRLIPVVERRKGDWFQAIVRRGG
jgi:hypothetical protein